MVASTPPAPPTRVVVLMPLRDDWASAAELIRRLEQAISPYPYIVSILMVDDGSVQDFRSVDFQPRLGVLRSIRILRLRRNVGHQRAIAIGLVHVEKSIPCDAVLVMDSDGEDTAEGALQLPAPFRERPQSSPSGAGGPNRLFFGCFIACISFYIASSPASACEWETSVFCRRATLAH